MRDYSFFFCNNDYILKHVTIKTDLQLINSIGIELQKCVDLLDKSLSGLSEFDNLEYININYEGNEISSTFCEIIETY